jgi:hypothetical protein
VKCPSIATFKHSNLAIILYEYPYHANYSIHITSGVNHLPIETWIASILMFLHLIIIYCATAFVDKLATTVELKFEGGERWTGKSNLCYCEGVLGWGWSVVSCECLLTLAAIRIVVVYYI